MSKKKMKVGSLFSGVGGFDLGLERAGMEVVAQCEWDPYRRQVLRRHWPGVPQFTDVREVRGRRGLCNLLVGGFPCQDLSIAGRRAGLDGARSGLFFEFARIADECIGDERDGEEPGWILIENVPGLLSSAKGRDFGLILATLADLGFHDLAWRVLDSRYFGVPQRRRRIFILARRARGTRAAQVLLEPESGGGNPAEGRAKGKKAAGAAARGAGEAGSAARGVTARYGKGTDSDATDTMVLANALDRQAGGADDNSAQGNHLVTAVGVTAADPNVAGTLGKKGEGGGGLGLDREGGFAVPTLRAGNAVRNNSNPVTEAQMLVMGDHAATLTSGTSSPGVNPPGRRKEDDENIVAVDPRNMIADTVAKTVIGGASKSNGGSPSLNDSSLVIKTEAEDTAKCLTAHERWDLDTETFVGPAERDEAQRKAMAFNWQSGGSAMRHQCSEEETTALVKEQTPAVMVTEAKAVWENQQAAVWETDYTNPMSTGGGKAGQGYALAHITQPAHYVRRLTPTECERLQGFPDGWTLLEEDSLAGVESWYSLAARGEPLATPDDEPKPDGRRYAAMGDAVTVPVIQWIGERILEHA